LKKQGEKAIELYTNSSILKSNEKGNYPAAPHPESRGLAYLCTTKPSRCHSMARWLDRSLRLSATSEAPTGDKRRLRVPLGCTSE